MRLLLQENVGNQLVEEWCVEMTPSTPGGRGSHLNLQSQPHVGDVSMFPLGLNK